MKFSDIQDISVDVVAEKTWAVWKAWRSAQGYVLGGVHHSLPIEDTVNRRSPCLVPSWDDVPVPSQHAFREMAALVLGGLQTMTPRPKAPAPPEPKKVLGRLMTALRDDTAEAHALLMSYRSIAPDEFKEIVSQSVADWEAGKKSAAKKGMMGVWKAQK